MSTEEYNPPFTVSAKAISLVAEISALIERYAISLETGDSLRLRRVNKVKTIHSSLAIEGNELTEDQVSDILEGKRIVAPVKEIQEVKNAIATYDLIGELSPFSIDDMLKAHDTMMQALIDDAGKFRQGGVGVVAGTQLVHTAPPADRVSMLMKDLFNWLKTSEDHLLIRSCVFHYEFEFIHPFSDGNGRIGRLWQSLILGQLHDVFTSLPVESMIYHNQQEYYNAINKSTVQADCGIFIDFMLSEIYEILQKSTGGVSGGVSGGVNAVLLFIENNPGSRAHTISDALQIPLRTLQRHLAQLKKTNLIKFCGAPKNGGYYLVSQKDNGND